MASTPTTADAELIVKLYDLRREPELRKRATGGSAFGRNPRTTS